MKNIIKYFLKIATASVCLIGIHSYAEDAKIIYGHNTEYGEVWVYEKYERRCLTFKRPPTSTLQTCINPKQTDKVQFNYAKSMLSSLFFNDSPKKILILGLGGGTLANSLNILVPDAKIDIVEINPSLPKIAQKYFYPNLKNKQNNFIIQDGLKFINESEENKYDIVMIDVFDADYIPEGFLTNEAMQNFKKVTKMGGIIAFNTFVNSDYTEKEDKLFADNFMQRYQLIQQGNKIIITSNWQLKNIEKIKKTAINLQDAFSKIGINASAIFNLYRSGLK